jgi:gamma-glutamylcyclotransferase (GGCT)/AIG2-like uncharacterized protein YtfP
VRIGDQSATCRISQVLTEPAPLFVYGSLLLPEVMNILIDRDPARTRAVVPGCRVVALAGKVYPALVRDPSFAATGEVVRGLTHDEWRVIDAFEDSVYELRLVATTDWHEQAWSYTLVDRLDDPDGWDMSALTGGALSGYLDRCLRWRQQYDRTR